MIITMRKDIDFKDLVTLTERYTPLGLKMLENKLNHIVSNRVLMVRNSIYYRIVALSYVDFPEENVRRYDLTLDIVDYTDEVLQKLCNMSLKELLPTKPTQKEVAE